MTDLFDSQSRPGFPEGAEHAAVDAAPTDIFAPVRGRMLVQVGPNWADRLCEYVSIPQSGLVISGARANGPTASKKAGQLRRSGYSGVLMADPGRYNRYATKDEPFLAEDQGSLLSMLPDSTVSVLQDELTTQLERGASFAMSPTGYIAPEDSGAFKAAARVITEFGDPRMIFMVPLSVSWLSKDRIAQTIAILGKVPGLKALVLGGQMDPLQNKVVANLCTLLAQVPDIAVLRTDIAAVGALAHGAAFTSFGNIASHRHLVPPTEKAKTGKGGGGGPKSPHVLYPELMSFYLGETIANRHADGSAPACNCEECAGRPLDRFSTKAQGLEREAVVHNIAVMTEMSAALNSPAAQADPHGWWHERCTIAVGKTAEVNAHVRMTVGKSFAPCRQLAQWAAVGQSETKQA
jgi:hypothetical protein